VSQHPISSKQITSLKILRIASTSSGFIIFSSVRIFSAAVNPPPLLYVTKLLAQNLVAKAVVSMLRFQSKWTRPFCR
jgi:hypothetical protein